jgi:hypothetical protein
MTVESETKLSRWLKEVPGEEMKLTNVEGRLTNSLSKHIEQMNNVCKNSYNT